MHVYHVGLTNACSFLLSQACCWIIAQKSKKVCTKPDANPMLTTSAVCGTK